TDVSAVPSESSATGSWLPSPGDGGQPITGFVITTSPGGVSTAASAYYSSVTVNGLTDGTSYSFTVAATNSIGVGSSSPTTGVVVPGPPPTAPLDVQALAGPYQARVSWQPPTSDGGNSVSSYSVLISPGGALWRVGGATTSAAITGLATSTSYSFTVTATNAAGVSQASAPSNQVTPT